MIIKNLSITNQNNIMPKSQENIDTVLKGINAKFFTNY